MASAVEPRLDPASVERLRTACREVHDKIGERFPGEPWTDAETELQAFADHGIDWLVIEEKKQS